MSGRPTRKRTIPIRLRDSVKAPEVKKTLHSSEKSDSSTVDLITAPTPSTDPASSLPASEIFDTSENDDVDLDEDEDENIDLISNMQNTTVKKMD